jgi:hypothetical protein
MDAARSWATKIPPERHLARGLAGGVARVSLADVAQAARAGKPLYGCTGRVPLARAAPGRRTCHRPGLTQRPGGNLAPLVPAPGVTPGLRHEAAGIAGIRKRLK